MYTTEELASRFNTTSQTIRDWAKEFSPHFDVAAKGNNRAFRFSENDLRTLTLIAELKARRMKHDEIETAILSGEDRTPPEPNNKLSFAGRSQIAQLKADKELLQHQLSEAIRAGDQKDGRIEELTKRNAELEKEVRQLIGDLAVLKSKGQG